MTVKEEKKERLAVNYLKFITFALGRERFGIPIDQVKEIIASYEVVPLPKTPDFIEGIISLRGEIIPVVEMRRRFEMPPREGEDEERRVIVLEMEDFIVGIQVDRVYEVLKLEEDAIEPPPRLVAGLKADYLDGVAEVNKKLTIILNLDEIFSTTEKIIIREGFEMEDAEGKEAGIAGKKTLSPGEKAKNTTPVPEVSTYKISASGQIRVRGKSYYVGKKHKGKEVSLEEAGNMFSVILDGEKIREFEP